MKIEIGKIAEIHEFEGSSFYVGKILNTDKHNFLFFHNVSPIGDYQGWAIMSLKNVHRIVFATKYIDFYKQVLNDDIEPPFICDNPKDFLKYCFENSRIVDISKHSWGDRVESIKIQSFNKSDIVAQSINSYGKFGKTIKIKYADISYILFDSPFLKSLEKYIAYQKNIENTK